MAPEPTFACQQCRTPLEFTADPGDPSLPQPPPTRLDESFLVLEEAAYSYHAGVHASALPPLLSRAGRRLDDSFVVLPQSRAPPPSALPPPLGPYVEALTRACEAASSDTPLDHPLCSDCAAAARAELEAELAQEQALSSATASSAALLPPPPPLQPEQFAQALQAAERGVEAERAALARAQAEAAAAEAELSAARRLGRELARAERRAWHEANALELALAEHAAARETATARLSQASAALEGLAGFNALNEIFKIWFEGAFGTIAGLRLGRTGAQPVEWDEINAAWGAAVLLLSVLARALDYSFKSYRLLPMGSYARVADARGSYDLFGPVSKAFCISYDRAQVGFLACLAEFAAELEARGGGAGAAAFVLPWPIQGDHVGSQSIRHMLAKDKNWTKALKYMLVDLKFCLKFAVGLLDGAGAAPLSALAREPPAR